MIAPLIDPTRTAFSRGDLSIGHGLAGSDVVIGCWAADGHRTMMLMLTDQELADLQQLIAEYRAEAATARMIKE